MSTTLIVPGLRSSGPTHWQTWLERRVSGSVRITQRDWNDPHLPEWSARVRREIVRATGPIFIAGHSFGALAAVQAASDHAERITGALLVAPADPEAFGVAEFLPTKPLGFPVIVVASRNDPWMAFDKARRWADLWRADFVDLGDAGHINSEAGFGPWPEGLALLERLRRAGEFRSAAERLAALDLSQSQPLQRHWLARRRYALGRGAQSIDRRDLAGAAALLRAAGWTVGAPAVTAHGAR
ncbi:alpha/beta hydrolase [Hyphomicrobium sp.]|uniref:RBBP9/YdeN family alpha/beta hydrolase n=1 Tax=Hyphomicrobium sp. TaxID=82 RepID=UPI001DD0FF3B|nr:alpha/beta hydrolase [Hyphomicrobium sp.]MBY0560831.1 alpha/beta hydrolase [Hyphomicrobium sp.]